MNKELLALINASNTQKKDIAIALEITPQYLSMCISGIRELSRKKERKLIELLKIA